MLVGSGGASTGVNYWMTMIGNWLGNPPLNPVQGWGKGQGEAGRDREGKGETLLVYSR